jgi:hypothetical protein
MRLLAAFTLMALTAAALADFALNTLGGVDRTSYTAAFHGAAWIAPPDSAPRSWFRLPLSLDQRPEAVSLLLDADQTYTLYVNGVLLGDDKADITNGFAQVHSVDITGLVVPGDNVVGVQVVNNNHGAAAMRARLTVVQGGHQVEALSGSAHWRATSDVAAVETPGLGADTMTWPSKPGTGVKLAPGQTIRPGSASQLGQTPAAAPEHRDRVTLLPPGQLSAALPTVAPSPGLSPAQAGALGSLGSNPAGAASAGGTVGTSGVPGAGSSIPGATATPGVVAKPAPLANQNGSVRVTTGSQRLLTQVVAGDFAIPGFADPSWRPALAVQAPRGDVSAVVPDWVVDQPLSSAVVTAPGSPTLLTVFATVTLRGSVDDGWVRIGASGDASVYLDGSLVIPSVNATTASTDTFTGAGTTGADPWRQLKPPVNVPRQSTGNRAVVPFVSAFHLGPLLHAGKNILAVVVTSASGPNAYVDGRIQTSAGSVTIGSGSLWTARSTSGSLTDPATTPAQVLGAVNAAWGNRPPVVPVDSGQLQRPEGMMWTPRIIAAGALVVAWVLIALLAWTRRRVRFSALLAAGAMGCIPGLVAIEIVQELSRLSSFRPPGLRVWPVLATLFAISVGGLLLSTVLVVRRGDGQPSWLGRALRRSEPRAVRDVRRRLAGATLSFASMLPRRLEPAGVGTPGGWGVSRSAAAATSGDAWHVRMAARAGAVTGRLPRALPMPPALSMRGLGARIVLGAYAMLRHWSAVMVGGIALFVGALNVYRLDYQPFWQDELFTLGAARGIRQHVFPLWPSGFAYWKGELYTTTIAVVGRIFGDSATSLRMVSVVLFVATIAAFGLLLVPEVIGRGRHWMQVGLTLLFATAPAEMTWAREARMYQMADFFMVLFLALFLRALRRPTTRNIAFATLSLLGMYLSHEETFIAVPAVALVGVLALRTQLWRNKRWLIFGGLAFGIIGAQAFLAFKVQPTWFGADHSNRSYVGFDTTDAYYYFSNVFFKGNGGLALVTTLATLGSAVGLLRRDLARNLLSGFLWTEIFMISVVFAPRIPRYTFIVLPPLFLLAALGAQDLLQGARRLITPSDASQHFKRAMRRMAAFGLAPVMIWLAVSQPATVQAYGVAVANVLRAPTQLSYVDYPYIADYMRRHWQPGDMWISAAPPNIVAEYFGRPPDRIIQTHSNDRFFYMFEKGGKAVDTQFGVPVILAPSDLQRVLETHHRIWLVTDDARYLSQLPPGFIDIINSHFAKVSEGATSALYVGLG